MAQNQQPQDEQYRVSHGQQYQPQRQQQSQGQTSQPRTEGQFGGMGQQFGGQQASQQGKQQVTSYDELLPNDMRTALHDFSHLKKSCEWAAEQVHGQMPGETEIPRTLEDLAEIAELNEKLIVRDSRHGPEVAETFLKVARQDVQQLQQMAQQQPVLVTVVSDLQRTINSTTQMLGSLGQQVGGQQSMGQQPIDQQSMGQQSIDQRSGGQQSSGAQSMGPQSTGGQLGGRQSAGQQSMGRQGQY
ncbi:hypothetical protein [Haladaptatus caseinilyticus]|uniref:hypothetical protein n=1 Tax=Haladaptatus caseinilyticus TaxID=2993314 RepID=UPI00224B5E6B|nr:hypothetical protein [Haladaptatus caseinilyticus]